MTEGYLQKFLCSFIILIGICEGQLNFKRNYVTTTPLPFPTCRADHLDCLRRGLRTFFFMMDAEYLDMKPVDPLLVNSVGVTLPEKQITILLRRANVTGARWTKLLDRKFNLAGGKSGVKFTSDLHVTGEIRMNIATRPDPYVGYVTVDIQETESNVTYPMSGAIGIDNEDYILIGPERIAVRNTKAPTFFVQPNSEDAMMIEQILDLQPSIIEHLTEEITTALMHSVFDNIRLFASKVPVKYYYKYF